MDSVGSAIKVTVLPLIKWLLEQYNSDLDTKFNLVLDFSNASDKSPKIPYDKLVRKVI